MDTTARLISLHKLGDKIFVHASWVLALACLFVFSFI